MQPRSSEDTGQSDSSPAPASPPTAGQSESGERPFSDFLSSGPAAVDIEPGAADPSFASQDADAGADESSSAGGSPGADGVAAEVVAGAEPARESGHARGSGLRAEASTQQQQEPLQQELLQQQPTPPPPPPQQQQQQQQWHQLDPSGIVSPEVAEQVEWAAGDGFSTPPPGSEQQGAAGGAAAPPARDYMAEYAQRYPASYQEAGFADGALTTLLAHTAAPLCCTVRSRAPWHLSSELQPCWCPHRCIGRLQIESFWCLCR